MDPTSISPGSPLPPEHYVYRPLDTKVDAIRLVTIKAATNHDDPIVCSVAHVTFSQRPKFEALSYRWGTGDADVTISIDGRTFLVRRNVYDALLFFRRFSRGLPIWIDAICINQDDMTERSSQVRIMPHIYSRAVTGLVWLGAKYSKYHPLKDQGFARSGHRRYSIELPDPFVAKEEAGKPIPGEAIFAAMMSGNFTATKLGGGRKIGRDQTWDDMLDELYSDDYWSRVWIVQEIGKAQQIEVCYGLVADTWEDFIRHFECERDTNRFPTTSGPLKLSRSRDGKYKGAHTLWALLTMHYDAEALDPRDKIYGLVGLATDTHGFPINYKKSLFDVWEDTVKFCQEHGIVNGDNIVLFARLVRDLLGGNAVKMGFPGSSGSAAEDVTVVESEESNAIQAASASAAADDESSSVCDSVAGNMTSPISSRIKVKIRIMGAILHLGPTPSQIVGSLDALDQWTASIQNNYKFDEGAAHRLNDAFIKRLLTLTERDLDGVSAITRELEFRRIHNNDRDGSPPRRKRKSRPATRSEGTVSDSEDQASSSDHEASGPENKSVSKVSLRQARSILSGGRNNSFEAKPFEDTGFDIFDVASSAMETTNIYNQSLVSYEMPNAIPKQTRSAWEEPRLFQLATGSLNRMYQMAGVGSESSDDDDPIQSALAAKMAWKLGVAPIEAKIEDLVCRIPGLDNTFVLRTQHDTVRFIGTAIFAENLLQSKRNERDMRHPTLFDAIGKLEYAARPDFKSACALVANTLDVMGKVSELGFGILAGVSHLVLYMDPEVLFSLIFED